MEDLIFLVQIILDITHKISALVNTNVLYIHYIAITEIVLKKQRTRNTYHRQRDGLQFLRVV